MSRIAGLLSVLVLNSVAGEIRSTTASSSSIRKQYKILKQYHRGWTNENTRTIYSSESDKRCWRWRFPDSNHWRYSEQFKNRSSGFLRRNGIRWRLNTNKGVILEFFYIQNHGVDGNGNGILSCIKIHNVNVFNLIGQTKAGASPMSRSEGGVQKNLLRKAISTTEREAFYLMSLFTTST